MLIESIEVFQFIFLFEIRSGQLGRNQIADEYDDYKKEVSIQKNHCIKLAGSYLTKLKIKFIFIVYVAL